MPLSVCGRPEAAACCTWQVAILEEQLNRLMQSLPADVSATSKGTTPLSPPMLQSSPSLAKAGRRRSAFELVRACPLCTCPHFPSPCFAQSFSKDLKIRTGFHRRAML